MSQPANPVASPDTLRRAPDGELFRRLVESVHDYAIFVLDPSGRVATWNVGAERIKGYTAAEIIGRHFSVFYPADVVQTGKCEEELIIAAHTGSFEEEGWRLRKDGSRFWASVVINVMRDASGRHLGFSKITRDLTERRRAEEVQAERRSVEERIWLLVESVRDYAIFMLDPTGHVATWNAGAERIKGYRADEIIGQHFSRFYSAEEVQAGKCEMELAVATRDGHFEEEGWRIRKDGTTFWANVVIGAVRDSDGQLIGFSKVTRDLTERKQAREGEAARLIAEQANRAKDEFLAMLGHELRNPLAPILTALQLMKLKGDSRLSREQEVIERQVQHMIHLVDDLLDIARVTRGTLELKRRHIDLRDTIASAIEVTSPLLEARRQHFTVFVAPRALIVDGDDARLVQVFSNLLGNAAKYTRVGGKIDLSARADGNAVVIEVRDDGQGIDPALLPKIFDLFVQGERTVDRAAGGLGLGLALVRALVGMHGGRVEAASSGPGHGSTFTIRLKLLEPRLNQTQPGRAISSPAPSFEPVTNPRRILVVDDNEDARVLLVESLELSGHEVRGAADPVDALTVVEGFAPEIAFLDIGLPVMDGYELAVQLRSKLGEHTPHFVALTGYGQENDRVRSVEAGFSGHLVKPVDIKRVLATIDELPTPKLAD